MTAFYGNDVSSSSVYPVMQEMISVMKSRGCAGLTNESMQNEIASRTPWCQGGGRSALDFGAVAVETFFFLSESLVLLAHAVDWCCYATLLVKDDLGILLRDD